MRKTLLPLVLALFAVVSCAHAQIRVSPIVNSTGNPAWFTGSYTFQMVSLKDYSVETNQNGQQVGFCNGAVVGYYCWNAETFSLLQGTLVSDGAGHILSGTYTETRDPNSYECDPENQPTAPCPVVVPAGNPYVATKAYGVGATIDYTVNGVTETFQAVRSSTGKTPDWTQSSTVGNICNYQNLSTCYWTQIPASLTNTNSGNTGTLTGTYSIQANGAGVMTLTPSNCGNCGSVQIAFTVAPAGGIGQLISLAGISQLSNSNPQIGTAVRVK